MACPYFYPVERIAQATGKKMAPMPLGEAWSGACRADPAGDWPPDANTAQQLCNFGYAHEKCGRIPAGGADAVRFSISYDHDDVIRIYWVVEKNHLPVTHGPLEYSRLHSSFQNLSPDACLTRQAEAYVDSYLRRKAETRRA